MPPKPKTEIEVWRGGTALFPGNWYWHAKARNGEIIAQSEGYTRRDSAVRGAERAFPGAPIFYLEDDV